MSEDYSDTTRAPHWLCSLLGCDLDIWNCSRCGEELYGGLDFVESGIIWLGLWWLRWHVWIPLTPRVCVICRRYTGFGKNAPACCSEKCWSEWVPF